MDIYFSDVLGIGNLYIEHVFYEYDEPVLFVCIDKNNNRYLCSCSRLSEQWLIGRAADEQIIDVIDKALTLDEAFRACKTLFCIRWDGEGLSVLDNIPDDAFPKKNSFLRLGEEQTGEYRRMIEGAFSQNVFYQLATSFIKDSEQRDYLESLIKILLDADARTPDIQSDLEASFTPASVQKDLRLSTTANNEQLVKETDNTGLLFAA